MRFLSVCSGIEAASMAWTPLGWEAAAFSEIDPFPRAVLSHRYPQIPLHGDFTTIRGNEYGAVDLLVGGTPCQSFSVAGLRGGLDDDRGNLALEFCRLAQRVRPRWIVWENVPGVLSSGNGRDFGSILGAMGELGYGWAYRTLDAQHWGVPQRRRRIFLVGCADNNYRRAAAVLFERSCLQRNSAPRREAGEDTASPADHRTERSSQAIGFNWQNGGGYGNANDGLAITIEGTGPLQCAQVPAVAQCILTGTGQRLDAETETLIPAGGRVRRLLPIECERLQGFPDNWTRIPWRGRPAEECPDGPRYKALGNSMCVPVVRWIGRRITHVEELPP